MFRWVIIKLEKVFWFFKEFVVFVAIVTRMHKLKSGGLQIFSVGVTKSGIVQHKREANRGALRQHRKDAREGN